MENENNKVVIDGTIEYLKYGTSRYDNEKKFRITITCDNIDRKAFDSVFKNNKFAPKWYEDESVNKVNLKTFYDIPVECLDDSFIESLEEKASDYITSLETFIDSNMSKDSKVRISINIKEKAIYPKAIQIIKLGDVYNPFSDFN